MVDVRAGLDAVEKRKIYYLFWKSKIQFIDCPIHSMFAVVPEVWFRSSAFPGSFRIYNVIVAHDLILHILNELVPWSRILCGKVTVSHLLKQFPTSCRTQMSQQPATDLPVLSQINPVYFLPPSFIIIHFNILHLHQRGHAVA
jgi:hypothetical protein